MNPPETDTEGKTRTFSIASAAFENQLMFATRMRDTAFKRFFEEGCDRHHSENGFRNGFLCAT